MTAEKKRWIKARDEYLRQVARALSTIKHSRSNDVLEDVRLHLKQRFTDLKPEQLAREDLNSIIAQMGPASDYAELLDLNATFSPRQNIEKRLLLIIIALAITAAIIAAMLIIRIQANPVTSESFPQNFSQKIS